MKITYIMNRKNRLETHNKLVLFSCDSWIIKVLKKSDRKSQVWNLNFTKSIISAVKFNCKKLRPKNEISA